MKNVLISLLLLAISSNSAAEMTTISDAYALHEKGLSSEAVTLLETIADYPKAQLALAEILEGTDLDEASDWIEKALDSAPQDPAVHFQLGAIRGRQAQNATFSALRLARQSKAAFEKAVELDPDNPKYLNGLIQFHLSAPSIAGGDLDEAERLAVVLEEMDPVSGVVAQSSIAAARDEGERALKILETGLTRYGASPILEFRAGMLCQEQERYDEAFKYLDRASQHTTTADPTTALSALYQVGRTAVISKQNPQQGIDALEQYIAEAPTDEELVPKPWAEYRLALLYEQVGRSDEATALLLKLQNTPDARLRKEVRSKI